MLASNSFRADLANARLVHERAVKQIKAIDKVVLDLATDDIVVFFCPQADCRETFNFGQIKDTMTCPGHRSVNTGRVCMGTDQPPDFKFIAAEDFVAPATVGVKESKSPGSKEALDAKDAHEVAELERL